MASRTHDPLSQPAARAMTPYFERGGVTLLGDCREMLGTLPDASVDAVVTDPPYELGFMGKGWDRSGIAFDPWTWFMVMRVLKPGGHLLAFGGSRTYHRMACAIEDAGFEIRDQIMWIYGSGFPKSLDISKAIDKAARRDYVLAAVKLGLAVPGNSLHDWTKAEHSPSDAWWERFKNVLSVDEWSQIEREVIGSSNRVRNVSIFGNGFPSDGQFDLTTAATESAAQWDGWGTALKPAHEPIVLARKPLSEPTIAANVLTHGCGGINVDGCRVAAPDGVPVFTKPGQDSANTYGDGLNGSARTGVIDTAGRWPANVCLDEEAAALLDAQSGTLTSGANPERRGSAVFKNCYGTFVGQEECTPLRGADSGGASRFFYQAKASQDERSAGLGDMPAVHRANGNKWTDQDYRVARGERTAGRESGPRQNDHPTVKPIALMRWLCRLITPSGGTVLDCFMGSGTTGCAAALEGFQFIGIEQDAHYFDLAQRRIAYWASRPQQAEMFA